MAQEKTSFDKGGRQTRAGKSPSEALRRPLPGMEHIFQPATFKKAIHDWFQLQQKESGKRHKAGDGPRVPIPRGKLLNHTRRERRKSSPLRLQSRGAMDHDDPGNELVIRHGLHSDTIMISGRYLLNVCNW